MSFTLDLQVAEGLAAVAAWMADRTPQPGEGRRHAVGEEWIAFLNLPRRT